MKVTRTIQVPASEDTVLDYIQCELCGAKTNNDQNWLTKSVYDINEVTVELRTGASFPEGGHSTSLVIDLCPTCFREKLLPWVEAQGGQTREKSTDW